MKDYHIHWTCLVCGQINHTPLSGDPERHRPGSRIKTSCGTCGNHPQIHIPDMPIICTGKDQ